MLHLLARKKNLAPLCYRPLRNVMEESNEAQKATWRCWFSKGQGLGQYCCLPTDPRALALPCPHSLLLQSPQEHHPPLAFLHKVPSESQMQISQIPQSLPGVLSP
jgi:hypothetical protein